MSSLSDDDIDKRGAGAIVDFINLAVDEGQPCSAFQKSVLMNNSDGFYCGDYRLDQYAVDVADFSSQYGSDYSISYTATNITGKPRKYPEYGDFPETYAMVRKSNTKVIFLIFLIAAYVWRLVGKSTKLCSRNSTTKYFKNTRSRLYR